MMMVVMDKKQKGLIALTVVAVGFLGYQVFQLVNGDVSQDITDSVIASMPTSQSKQPVNEFAPSYLQTTKPVNTPKAVPANMLVKKPTMTTPDKTVENNKQAYANAMAKSQQSYLKMINQYELAKMQRQLLDEQAAIESARNKIIQISQKNKALGGNHNFNTSGLSASGDLEALRLSYIDKQDDAWTATIGQGDQYQQVSVGSILPGNYKVLEINHRGVLLKKNNKQLLITFSGNIEIPTTVNKVASPPKIKKSPDHFALARHTVQKQQLHKLVETVGAKHAPAISLEKRAEIDLKKQISVGARDAVEGPDTLMTDSPSEEVNLPFGLHLRAVTLNPIVHEPYQSSNYLAPAEKIPPRSYHLIRSEKSHPNKYYEERKDSYQVSNHAGITPEQCAITKMASNTYTIQMLGSRDASVIKHFIYDNHLQDTTTACHVHGRHGNWYMAFHGSYPSFADAEATLVNLPENFRHSGPWVRKVSEIQRDLNRT